MTGKAPQILLIVAQNGMSGWIKVVGDGKKCTLNLTVEPCLFPQMNFSKDILNRPPPNTLTVTTTTTKTGIFLDHHIIK
jgi:hypothetical protein